ncbi:unnamed protein product [Vitrella brassicaformis CCMP3155]|uniref:LAA1-like C-terminal TPR repeats domain-containing protein n=2 Tax=Vitrella brassicaformis TaxID=1169539 RepID=A0A0G4F8S1_VITBC|nr:unnamed protein product [Vitrella brassicaformis CCMP3155]|eukprot:CEM09114.1 unnamed protein product [Vitrella brassicaformis CCMP3155]
MADQLVAQLELLRKAVSDASAGQVTNGRKMEVLRTLPSLLPSLPKDAIRKHQKHLEDLTHQLVKQNPTQVIKRLLAVNLVLLYRHGDSVTVTSTVSQLVLTANSPSAKVAPPVRAAALAVVGEMVAHPGDPLAEEGVVGLGVGTWLSSFLPEIVSAVGRHQRVPEAGIRESALLCLWRCLEAMGGMVGGITLANEGWKVISKALADKAPCVRAAAYKCLGALAWSSPVALTTHFDSMVGLCVKNASEEGGGVDRGGRRDLVEALAAILTMAASLPVADAQTAPSSMGMTVPWLSTPTITTMTMDKKRRAVVDTPSALTFLTSTFSKPNQTPQLRETLAATYVTVCTFKQALSEQAIHAAYGSEGPDLSEALQIWLDGLGVGGERSALGLVGFAGMPQAMQRGAGWGNTLDGWHAVSCVSHSSRGLVRLARGSAPGGPLASLIERVLCPFLTAYTPSTSPMQMVCVLEVLAYACYQAGESLCTLETQVTEPLLYILSSVQGEHATLLQQQAAWGLRIIAHASPPKLFQLLSVLLNLSTIDNAELMAFTSKDAAKTDPDGRFLEGHLRSLCGHCTALASLVAELSPPNTNSRLAVPHDVTSAVMGTCKALTQAHPLPPVFSQRRLCAFVLLEPLMALGDDWTGARLTTVFALWKSALGKKSIDGLKQLYQYHHPSPGEKPSPPDGEGAPSKDAKPTDELLVVLAALKSLLSFLKHSKHGLLVSLPHLHKIVVVFLTNVSQLVSFFPHPYSMDGGGPRGVTFSGSECGMGGVLLAMRAGLYEAFAAIASTHYAGRFVSLLNLLADDLTRPAASPVFPLYSMVSDYLPSSDHYVDLSDLQATQPDTPITLPQPHPSPSSTSHQPLDDDPDGPMPPNMACVAFGGRMGGLGVWCPLWDPWDVREPTGRPLLMEREPLELRCRTAALCLFGEIMAAPSVPENTRMTVIQHLMKKYRQSAPPSTTTGASTTSGISGTASAIPSSLHQHQDLSQAGRTASTSTATATAASAVASIIKDLPNLNLNRPAAGSSSSSAAAAGSSSGPLHTWDASLVVPISVMAGVLSYLLRAAAYRGQRDKEGGDAGSGLGRGEEDLIVGVVKEGLLAQSPLLVRMHVEVFSLLFVLHELQRERSSGAAPPLLDVIHQFTANKASPQARASAALLCGSLIRCFSQWAPSLTPNSTPSPSPSPSVCPYLRPVMGDLLSLATETAQPGRLAMLHAFGLIMDATGGAFLPYMKDSLTFATAHLLADPYPNPLIAAALSHILMSAVTVVLSPSPGDAGVREEALSKVVGVWSELRFFPFPEATAPLHCAVMSVLRRVVLVAPWSFDLSSSELAGVARVRLDHPCSTVRWAALEALTALLKAHMALPALLDEQLDGLLFVMLDDEEEPLVLAAARRLIALRLQQEGLSQLPKCIGLLKSVLQGSSASDSLRPVRSVRTSPAPPPPRTPSSHHDEPPNEQKDSFDDDVNEDSTPPTSPTAGGRGKGASMTSSGQGLSDGREGGGRAGSQRGLPSGLQPRMAPSLSRRGRGRSREAKATTKAFAIRCLRWLLELASPHDASRHYTLDPEDVHGRGSEGGSGGDDGCLGGRLVHHLETLLFLACGAVSSPLMTVAEEGTHLLLLLVQRFKRTKDPHKLTDDDNERDDGESADRRPPLLLQFEAPLFAALRQTLQPDCPPPIAILGLHLLFELLTGHLFSSSRRLVQLLLGPLQSPLASSSSSSAAAASSSRRADLGAGGGGGAGSDCNSDLESHMRFNPFFCERESSKLHLCRIKLACRVAEGEGDVGVDEIRPYLPDLTRHVWLLFRDCVLLQSEMSSTFLRSYQPYSLVMADCKALASTYRTILTDTTLFRGLNALARHNHLQPLMQPAAKPSSPTPPSPPSVIILGYAVHRLTQLASQRGKDGALGGNDLSASFRELGVGDSAVGESEVTEMRCIVECVRHLMGLRREGGGGVAESDWGFAEEVLRGVWEATFHHTDPTVRSMLLPDLLALLNHLTVNLPRPSSSPGDPCLPFWHTLARASFQLCVVAFNTIASSHPSASASLVPLVYDFYALWLSTITPVTHGRLSAFWWLLFVSPFPVDVLLTHGNPQPVLKAWRHICRALADSTSPASSLLVLRWLLGSQDEHLRGRLLKNGVGERPDGEGALSRAGSLGSQAWASEREEAERAALVLFALFVTTLSHFDGFDRNVDKRQLAKSAGIARGLFDAMIYGDQDGLPVTLPLPLSMTQSPIVSSLHNLLQSSNCRWLVPSMLATLSPSLLPLVRVAPPVLVVPSSPPVSSSLMKDSDEEFGLSNGKVGEDVLEALTGWHGLQLCLAAMTASATKESEAAAWEGVARLVLVLASGCLEALMDAAIGANCIVKRTDGEQQQQEWIKVSTGGAGELSGYHRTMAAMLLDFASRHQDAFKTALGTALSARQKQLVEALLRAHLPQMAKREDGREAERGQQGKRQRKEGPVKAAQVKGGRIELKMQF